MIHTMLFLLYVEINNQFLNQLFYLFIILLSKWKDFQMKNIYIYYGCMRGFWSDTLIISHQQDDITDLSSRIVPNMKLPRG